MSKKHKAYPKYKSSGIDWIGDIPEHWEVKKLKYLSYKSVQYGLNISAEEYVSNGVRFIRTTDISDNGQLFDNGVYVVNSNLINNFLLDIGDFIISRSGTIGRAYVHQTTKNEHTFASYLVRFNFKDINISKFLYYFTKSCNFNYWLNIISIESTIGNVNGQKYANLTIGYPYKNEIKSIIQYLDHQTSLIDEAVAKQERLISLLEEKRTTIINNATTKGLDPNVKMKPSGIDWIGDIPEHWEVRRLKFIMGYCKGKNPEFLTSVNGLDYLPYLSMAYLRNLVSIDDVLYTKMEKGLIQVEEGDILLLWDGANAGEIIKGKKGFLSSTMAKLDFKLNISKSYSFYVLKYLEKTLRKDIVGMGIPHVNSKQLNNLPLLLPELLEQKQIADYLDHQTSLIDEAVSKSKELIEKLKEKRIALISSVVCGKIDVRGSD